MATLSDMTSRQWLATAGFFLAGGYLSFVLITFLPVFIVFGTMILAYAFLEFVMGGLLIGVYRAVLWPFRRNRPKPVIKEEPDKPISPWPIRYAFVIGFFSYFALAWALTYNGVKGYM